VQLSSFSEWGIVGGSRDDLPLCRSGRFVPRLLSQHVSLARDAALHLEPGLPPPFGWIVAALNFSLFLFKSDARKSLLIATCICTGIREKAALCQGFRPFAP
jgi:hypothetical protein